MEQPENRPFLPSLCDGWAVLVVIVVAELMAVVLTLMGGFYQPFSFNQLAIYSFFMQWVGITSAAMLCRWRHYLNRQKVAVAALLVVLIVAGDTFIFSLLGQAFKSWLAGVTVSFSILNADVLRATLIAAILAGMTMRYFYVQEELLKRRESELKARIQSLQSRIRPHFLFNSMNIISSLIAEEPNTAEQAVEDLSELFRASLKESHEQVRLAEELDLCRRYVRIEQLRMGDRLQVNWQIDDRVLNQKLPLLMLQPLLENAIYHGIQPLPEGGKVTLAAQIVAGQVVISVSNPVANVQSAHSGNRMALENIRHRLQVLHGADGRLESGQTASQFNVTIRFPYVKGHKEK